MSDTDEDSSSSGTQWPVNEDWIRKVLHGQHGNETDIKIVVRIYLSKSNTIRFIMAYV